MSEDLQQALQRFRGKFEAAEKKSELIDFRESMKQSSGDWEECTGKGEKKFLDFS